MGTMSEWATLKDRAAGKWQIPALAFSLLLLASSLFRLHPSPVEFPPDRALLHLEELVSSAQHRRAIGFGDALLLREELLDPQRGLVHLALARGRYHEARLGRRKTAGAGKQVVEHYRDATLRHAPLSASDQENWGAALEWQGRYGRALERYEKALRMGVDTPLHLRKHTLLIMRDRLDMPPDELDVLVEQFLGTVGDDRRDLKLWAIQTRLELLDDLDRLDEGNTLLARHREVFQATALRDHFAYLEAWMLYRTDHFDQAENQLRTIRNRVDRGDEVYAMTGWLLGTVAMSDTGPQRPAEALSFFEDVIDQHTGTPYAVASRVGSGEALAMLERYDEAIEAFRVAIEELASVGGGRVVDRDAVGTSLGVRADIQRKAGRLSEAVEFARLAVSLISASDDERAAVYLGYLAQTQAMLAFDLNAGPSDPLSESGSLMEASSPEAREMFAEAASTYLQFSQLATLNERRAADSSWRAAELFAWSGERDRAGALFMVFVRERPTHPLIPRALLRVGQLRQVSGDLSGAVEAFQECYRRYPRSLDGARALVPLARCYLAMGPDHIDLAEKTLHIVLEESEVFTPLAPEFADALFALGETMDRRGDYEGAIAVVEEVLERYPGDPRAWRARFLLADSYRRSGLALKGEIKDAESAGEIEQMRSEVVARMQTARQLYRQLIKEYEHEAQADLSRLERMYLRYAHLYEADCHFETQDYRRALKLYEEAAGVYKDSPSALAAYVQIINSHVFLGEPEEARAALARALVLVNSIPDRSFLDGVSPERRKDWKRYFEWLGESTLF